MSTARIPARRVCADLRPYLTQYPANGPAIMTDERAGGSYTVDYVTPAGERRSQHWLTKPEATARVSALRSRGYKASYRASF